MGIFPKALFSWVNRIDHTDIDFAEDINSVANELIGVETTLGIQPQVENSPAVGGPVTYTNVSARISATASGTNLPVVELNGSNQNVATGQQVITSYNVKYDPFQMWNGRNITIPVGGWWVVTAHNVWRDPFVGAGFSLMIMELNQNVVDTDVWNWALPNHNLWPLPVGSSSAGVNHCFFQGLANKGDQFSVLTTNGTYENPHQIKHAALKAHLVRVVTGSFNSDFV